MNPSVASAETRAAFARFQAGRDLTRTSPEKAPAPALNNSSGFGGSTACHVLRRPA